MKTFFFAASGLGVLVGLLLGMSASPVVGAALAAVLPFAIGFATWFAGKKSLLSDTGANVAKMYSLMVGGFAWFAALAACGGVAIRTHGLLSPSPARLIREWRDAGFKEDIAKEIVIVQMGASGSPTSPESPVPKEKAGSEATPKTLVSSGFPDLRRSAFYADEGQKSMRRLKGMIGTAKLDELSKSFMEEGGVLKQAVEYVERSEMNESEKKRFLENMYEFLVFAAQP